MMQDPVAQVETLLEEGFALLQSRQPQQALELIRKALQRFQGNVSQAAEALGLSRGALYRRMEKYGL